MQLSGYPLVRGPYDLELTVNGYPMNASALDSIEVVDSSLAGGTTINFFARNLPETVKELCGMPCVLDLTITMIKEPKKTSDFSLSYFEYPEADTLSIVPTMGPIGGGTIFTLKLLDFTGAATRDKAYLPNLLSVHEGRSELMVWFTLAPGSEGGESWNGTVLEIAENTAERAEGTIVLDLEVLLPESVGGEGVATIFFTIDGVEFNVQESAASLQFEYVGTQILYVTPGSGLLNPGSGGMEVNVVVLNLPQDLSNLNILMGSEPCTVNNIAQSDSELGVASSIGCLAGELPLTDIGTSGLKWQRAEASAPTQGEELINSGLSSALSSKTEFTQQEWEAFGISNNFVRMDHFIRAGDGFYFKPAVGVIQVTVTAPGMEKILTEDWQYLAPPRPAIAAESVFFDGRNELWAASGRKGRSSRLKITNLSPKYSMIFDEIRISFDGNWNGTVLSKPATAISFVPIGTDVEVAFMTPELMPPSWMYLTVSVYRDGLLLITLTHFSDGEPFHVEFRDLSQPRTIAWAPSEGSARGGILWMAGVQSLDSYFNDPIGNPIEVDFGVSTPSRRLMSAAAEVLAVMSVAEYREQGAKYAEVMGIPQIESWFLGISDDYRSDVVAQTVAAIEDSAFNPNAAFQVAALVFVWIPSLPAGEAAVSIKAGGAHVVANFDYKDDPVGPATLITAATDAGDLRSGMGGNVRVVVVLSDFGIVYKGSDVLVMFGDDPLPVNRLAYSSSTETKLYLVVPPSLPAVLQVTVAPVAAPTNMATFQFTYWDDRMPVLMSLSPFLVYETGGVAINITGSDVPVLESLSQYRVVVRQGMQVTTVGECV